MKRLGIIIIFALALCTALIPIGSVSANTYDYFCISDDNVVLYSDASCSNELFLLTKTYYVKKLPAEGENFKVLNGEITGFIKKSDEAKLVTSSYSGSQNYYYAFLLETIDKDMGRYSDTACENKTDDLGAKIMYIGKTTKGTLAFSEGSAVLYAKGAALNSGRLENITAHPVAATPPTTADAPKLDSDKTPTPASNNLVKTMLIVAICVLSILIVFLIFKPVKRKNDRYSISEKQQHTDHYDDYNDYR